MEARDLRQAGRPPKRILKQLEAIEAELKQPRVTNNSLVPDKTSTCVDQQDHRPPESSYHMTTKGNPKNTEPEQSHRYALRSRGSCNQT